MAVGRHLVVATKEEATGIAKRVQIEPIIYPVSFNTLKPVWRSMSTSFVKKIAKKRGNFHAALGSPLMEGSSWVTRVARVTWQTVRSVV
jgi:hypothetical protein